jgi:hypothetical protein
LIRLKGREVSSSHAYIQVKFEGKALRADTVKNKFCGIEPEERTLSGLIFSVPNNAEK